jgi:hypothetical protein
MGISIKIDRYGLYPSGAFMTMEKSVGGGDDMDGRFLPGYFTGNITNDIANAANFAAG